MEPSNDDILDIRSMATYVEVQAQIQELTRQAEALKRSERAAVIAEIREKMTIYEITLDDLKGSPRKGITLPPKYRDPDTGATWTGRGIRPKWLSDGLREGKPLSYFEVPLGALAKR